ncbi:mitochondrial pyruvate dehydrogenase E1 component beta subunit [Ephemerocybe angulata]|uniref:Mitochondrial pyruvate dehydrogenase E1 component beta subunit n=1 Tax=Ephemerocybe angulata TaxID=980116 RepID=A0A8H6HRK1_9AGAR|nr:mitochondrial pyruvate dehydrogenase E1 component beta subunit [Tulosesus angulatus]
MASLARVRLLGRRLPLGARGVQTTADTTQLHQAPSDASEPFTLKLHEDSFQTYNCPKPDLEVQVTKSELLEMYQQMTTMRRMEMAADALYKAKMIRGSVIWLLGSSFLGSYELEFEAVSVGMEHGIEKDDRVITGYRCHPFAVLRGGSIKGVIAELLGRKGGMSQGKGGSMHIFTPSFFGGNGIVGAQVPVGAGAAFAQMYKGEKNCTFAMYGDGASNQGQVFEAYNMAKLWNLPTDFVNGMDIIAAKQAVAYARKWAVDDQNGPLVLEFVTYRYGGHSMSDPGTTYRTREEVQRMRSTQDPIRGLQRYLEEWGVATEQELKAIDKEAKATVDQAVAEAKESPEPPLEDLWKDVYFKGTEPQFLRGREREEGHRFLLRRGGFEGWL